MFIVILTVSLAAFLQGFVQSSINGASLYAELFIDEYEFNRRTGAGNKDVYWQLGAANAAPWFSAALLGCWISLPLNDRVGRRGSIAVAAILVLISSIGSSFCREWYQLFAVRIINGIGMGIKAVSTPILASETSVGYWRGTSILAWQLVSEPPYLSEFREISVYKFDRSRGALLVLPSYSHFMKERHRVIQLLTSNM